MISPKSKRYSVYHDRKQRKSANSHVRWINNHESHRFTIRYTASIWEEGFIHSFFNTPVTFCVPGRKYLGKLSLHSSSVSPMHLWQPTWDDWSRNCLHLPCYTHSLWWVESDGGRLEMENKDLPGVERAIMFWPDVQPNVKNSISQRGKKIKHKIKQRTKQKAFHLW